MSSAEKNNTAEIPADRPKPFLQHLEELRWTIFGSLIALASAMLICIPLAPFIFKWLCAPLRKITAQPELFLRSLDVTGAFSVILQTVFWGGLVLSAPIILLVAGRFVFPGLTRRERQMARAAGSLALALFIFGAALGFFVTLPIALKIFFSLHAWLGIQAEWTAPSYIAFCLQLLLLFGLSFELPLLIMILGYFQVVSAAFLRLYRRHAIVVILILAMVLTPGPDVVSQLIMALPMFILYEACIWIIRLFERRRSSSGGLATK